MSRRFRGGDAFRCLMQCGLEALDRFAKVFGTEAESLMMDRHDEMSAGFIGHLHRLFRSTVRMYPRIVSANRHDRQIDGRTRVIPQTNHSAQCHAERMRRLFLSRT